MNQVATDPSFVRDIKWKEDLWRQEFYITEDYNLLHPPRGIHAVCFTPKAEVLFFKHIDGYNSLAGGGIESNEDPEKALGREIKEEAAAKLLECGMIGYIKSWPIRDPARTDYTLRYWAMVEPMNRKVSDPCKKSQGRIMTTIEQAAETLGWGDFGKLLIDLSLEAVRARKLL